MKNKIPTSPLRFIFYITKSHKLLLVAAIFFVFLVEIISVLNPVILGKIVDLATEYGKPNGPELILVAFFVALYPLARLVMVLGIRGTGYALHYVTAYMRTDAYRILFKHLSLHSSAYFSDRFAGSVSSDVNVVGQNMVRITNFFTYSVLALLIAIVSSFFVIATASKMLALFYILGILILVPINYFLSKRTIKLSKEAVKTLSKLRGQIVDSITNIVAVQQFAMRGRELDRLDTSITEHQKADIKSDVYSETVLLINNILVMSFIGGLMIGAFFLWKDAAITLGQFVMVLTLTTTIIRGLTRIGTSINDFSSIYGQTEHTLKEILIPHDIVDAKDAKELVVSEGRIDFDDVGFSYDESSTVFESLSLSIEQGQRVGVVGPSGGGKTTLVKLLLRQHDLQSGAINIDGQALTDVTQNSLRQLVGIVPQEPLLFHRSLRENIAYGKPDATQKEVEEAAKKALIHDFIDSLPEKYETLTGERGIKLSGGQRQRVAIARAILKAAPILVLDEATSALDSESEQCVQEGLKKLMEGKTVIAIAHRLSTIKEMDRIIVFEKGKVVQDGPHEELLKDESGTYARLWGHQAGGFLQEDKNLKVI